MTKVQLILTSGHDYLGLSLIFKVGGDLHKIARDSSCCSEVNRPVLYKSSWGYTSKYARKIPGPWPLMTALIIGRMH